MKTLIVLVVLAVAMYLLYKAVMKSRKDKAHRESLVSFAQDQIQHTKAAQVQRRQPEATRYSGGPALTTSKSSTSKPAKRKDRDDDEVSEVTVFGDADYSTPKYEAPEPARYIYEPPTPSFDSTPSSNWGSPGYSSAGGPSSDSGSSSSGSSSTSSYDSGSSGGSSNSD